MNYRSAFEKLISIYDYKILQENFLVRSFLFDYVGNSYIDKELVDAFFIINKYSIYENIRFLTLYNAKNAIKEMINKEIRSHSIEQYVRSVEPLLFLLYPNEYKEYKSSSNVKVKKMVKKKSTVIIKPQVKKIPKKSLPISSLVIESKSRSLTISTWKRKDYRIFNKDGVDVTSTFKPKKNCETLSIIIPSKRGSYTVKIPKTDYKNMRINYSGKLLAVNEVTCDNFKCVNSNAVANFVVDSESFTLAQNSGAVKILGNINKLSALLTKTSVEGCLYSSNPELYSISTTECDIKLETLKAIHPSFNRAFKRVQEVNGLYTIGKKPVKLFLKTTEKGRISAK